MKRTTITIAASLLLLSGGMKAQYVTRYPGIPRIDVHAHPHNIHYNEGLGTKTYSIKTL